MRSLACTNRQDTGPGIQTPDLRKPDRHAGLVHCCVAAYFTARDQWVATLKHLLIFLSLNTWVQGEASQNN